MRAGRGEERKGLGVYLLQPDCVKVNCFVCFEPVCSVSTIIKIRSKMIFLCFKSICSVSTITKVKGKVVSLFALSLSAQ